MSLEPRALSPFDHLDLGEPSTPTPALCWSPSLGYHWQTPPRASLSSMFPRPPVASRAIMSLDDVGCILAGYLIVILLVAMSGANNSAWFTAQGCPLPPSLQVP